MAHADDSGGGSGGGGRPARPGVAPGSSWSPKWSTVVAAAAGAVVLGAGSVSYSSDIVGRGLLAVAAILLIGIAVVGGFARPRLEVLPGTPEKRRHLGFTEPGGDSPPPDAAAAAPRPPRQAAGSPREPLPAEYADGPPRLAVRTLFSRRVYRMDQLYRVRVVRYPRLGRRVPILEIDARSPVEKLELLSRWDLGTNPDRVLHALADAGALPPEPTGL